MTAFSIDLYYICVAAISVACSFIVMNKNIPTGTSGTVGFTIVALVTFGIASDWLDSNLPWIGVKRGLLLWAGLLFILYWAMQRPWLTRERRWNRSHHMRAEDKAHESDPQHESWQPPSAKN